MKKILLASALAVSSLVLSAFVVASPRVAVMDFDNRAGYGDWRIGRGAADILTTELVKNTKFQMFERDRLNAVLSEQNLGTAGLVDPASAAKVGKLIGVQYIITGSVTEYGESSSGVGASGLFEAGKKGYFAGVDVRLVDVNTGRILLAESGQGFKNSTNVRVMGIGGGERFNEKHATEAMRLAIRDIADKIGKADLAGGPSGPVEILIADVDGRTITLNQGSGAGLAVGDVLNVKRQGRVIKDPSTGAVIRVTYENVGTIRLTEVAGSYAVGSVASGSGFSSGDKVEK